MSAPDTAVVAQVRAVLAEVIGPSVTQLDNPSRDSVPEWDSLAHVELLFTLEERFSVRFPSDQIGALKSLETIVKALEHG